MPVHNADITAIFTEIADRLEIEGANPFRIRAYRNAARILGDLPQEVRLLVEREGRRRAGQHRLGCAQHLRLRQPQIRRGTGAARLAGKSRRAQHPPACRAAQAAQADYVIPAAFSYSEKPLLKLHDAPGTKPSNQQNRRDGSQ